VRAPGLWRIHLLSTLRGLAWSDKVASVHVAWRMTHVWCVVQRDATRRDATRRRFQAGAVCILDDFVEQLGPAAVTVVGPIAFPLLVKSCAHPAPIVRQAAVYGLGVCAELGGIGFNDHMRAATDALIAAAQDTVSACTSQAMTMTCVALRSQHTRKRDRRHVFFLAVGRSFHACSDVHVAGSLLFGWCFVNGHGLPVYGALCRAHRLARTTA